MGHGGARAGSGRKADPNTAALRQHRMTIAKARAADRERRCKEAAARAAIEEERRQYLDGVDGGVIPPDSPDRYEDIQPLDYLMRLLQDTTKPDAVRFLAAREAARYKHAVPKPQEIGPELPPGFDALQAVLDAINGKTRTMIPNRGTGDDDSKAA